MAKDLDDVQRYGQSHGFDIRPRTILVEGTTDVELFRLAARLERESTGLDVFGDGFAVVAAGVGNAGGVNGVILQLHVLRQIGKACLLQSGKPRYRFVGLFDNDQAGQKAVPAARYLDLGISEYWDVFRLQPIMPRPTSVEPIGLRRAFESANGPYAGLEWELEDLLPQGFLEAFEDENPTAVSRRKTVNGKVHRDMTHDGKARFHRFVKLMANRADLGGVLDVLKSLRHYVGLK